jgi:hypothetical protein
MIKYIQGMFISWDIKIYDRVNCVGTKVQTSTLNEELGQVKVNKLIDKLILMNFFSLFFLIKLGRLRKIIWNLRKCQ